MCLFAAIKIAFSDSAEGITGPFECQAPLQGFVFVAGTEEKPALQMLSFLVCSLCKETIAIVI